MSKHGIQILATLALAAAAVPALASGHHSGYGLGAPQNSFRIQLGEFEPEGDSSYWTDKALEFTGDASDFRDIVVGASFVRFVSRRLGVEFSSNYYSGRVAQHYLDFVDESGGEIFHDTTLDLANFNVGLLFHLTRRDATVVPYVGAGGGLYVWSLTEEGDFIDFDRNAEIFFGAFEDDGTTFGYYLRAGLEVPVGRFWSLYGDVRWESAEDDLAGGLAGLGDLDISGQAYSIGAAFTF